MAELNDTIPVEATAVGNAMNLDISEILKDWPYEPGKVTVRKIRGADGQEKIQLRLDLGLLQMATTGRPDGARPHGEESYLAYYEHQLAQHKAEHGNDKGFELDEKACELLRNESVMYYHRYLAAFVLEDYEDVERDTARNLRAMDLCNEYGGDQSDRYAMEQYRAYVLMMNTRARAQAALRDNRTKAALAAVKLGMDRIRDFYHRFDQDKLGEGSAELAILDAMAREIEASIPNDPVVELRRRLKKAVSDERYEEAAALRDQLRQLSDEEKDS